MLRLLDAAERWIPHTTASITQPGHGSVVGPAGKLLLHGLREYWSLNIRILRYFRCEFSVEVGSVSCISLASC